MKRKKPHKRHVMLSHDQKREVAKQIVAGRHLKQLAAEWNISAPSLYKIVQDYTITARFEKFPLDSVQT